MVYVEETQKRMDDRLKQRKDDVRQKRERNVMNKHCEETEHEIAWKGREILEQKPEHL